MPESSQPTTPAATGPAKRACDCCHKRKVKCIGNGTRPCRNCASAGLTCTYNAIPQKKGPKGSRAKVISELRETQHRHLQATNASSLALVSDSYLAQSQFPRTRGLLSPDLINACVDYFFLNVYPSQPILHRGSLQQTISIMEINVEAYCLVTSLCAYMLIQPNLLLNAPGNQGPTLGLTLLKEALRVRKGCDYLEEPTIMSVITSFFLFGCYFCLDKTNTAWFHLREATTLAYVVRLHEEDSYATLGPVEASRRRRLYWLLFVTERAYALQRHRPLSLQATINLPSMEEDPTESVEISGFLRLIHLFRPFDDTFVGLWNKTRVDCTTDWLTELQHQLTDALPAYLQTTETQAADLRVSQQWLKTMIWQLSISHGYLSSTATDPSMTFQYPIGLARELISSASSFSQAAMEVHGIGLVEKLFDITCTLIDVLACVPVGSTFEFGPRDYLNQLLTLISNLRGGHKRFMPLLQSKMHDNLPSSIPNSGIVWPSSQPYDSPTHHEGSLSRQTSHVASPFGSPAQGNIPMAPSLLMFDGLSPTNSPVSNPDYSPVLCGASQTSSTSHPNSISGGQQGYHSSRHQMMPTRSQQQATSAPMTSIPHHIKFELKQ
ncbi:hypothetical protein K461DRAFT_222293 [Myriangium duriaei CBS 260.36]|uniref:Zn(2)-C6 fungal-type domain-containing protein n=1 Tax=Myriangium duriaei CBS 260.36 TaxID=1168546 RepID=A0A9P4J326_9PEZI|nr:hypothetical protein K461DRAFT_222293 [Myriangium duriaei CBS 260.36]